MNLRVMQPSRKKPWAGDVFAMQLPDERFLFGRVINDDAISGLGIRGAILIYVYRPPFESTEVPQRSEI